MLSRQHVTRPAHMYWTCDGEEGVGGQRMGQGFKGFHVHYCFRVLALLGALLAVRHSLHPTAGLWGGTGF